MWKGYPETMSHFVGGQQNCKGFLIEDNFLLAAEIKTLLSPRKCLKKNPANERQEDLKKKDKKRMTSPNDIFLFI